jgi:hypothetical protein
VPRKTEVQKRTTMSLRGSEMVKRWKERHRSHSGTSTEPSAAISRPTTAVDSWAEYNQALPRLVGDAVLAAFSSDVFKDAVASLIDPVLTKQQEKLNQLKVANLNLESTIQTRLDELPSFLQPAIDHMTSIEIPNHEKELETLSVGQKSFLDLLQKVDERLSGIGNQLQVVDGRMKALEDKVISADLRSAIRFGEISNEFQDRNTTLGDRLWEVEREVGSKIDGQQRRVVGVCEELGKAIRKTQDRISSLETMLVSKNDEGSASNSELLEKIGMVGKSVSKLDAMENDFRRDINAVRVKVSALDTSPLESYPRKFDAIERTISNLKTELETQGTLASLDSKLLSGHGARLDTVISNVSKIGVLVESIKEEISEDDPVQFSHTEKLESLESKVDLMASTIGAVQKHVVSLDTSALASQSETIGDLASGVSRIEGQLFLLDTTPLSSHSKTLDELKSTISELRANLDHKFSSYDVSFKAIDEKVASLPRSDKVDLILVELEDAKRNASDGLASLSSTVGDIFNIAVSTQDTLSSNSNALDNTSQALAAFNSETASRLEPLSSSLEDIGSRISLGNGTLSTLEQGIQNLSSKISAQGSDLGEVKRSTAASAADIVATLKKQEVGLEALNGNLVGINKSMEEIHGSTMSEIRHKSATILARVEQCNTSHSEHAASFNEVKQSNDTFVKAVEEGFASLAMSGKKSQTGIESISTALEEVKHTHTENSTALKKVINLHQKESKSLEELHTNTSKLLSEHEKSNGLVERHTSVIDNLRESGPKKEDISALQSQLGSALQLLEKHRIALEGVSTRESISTLSEEVLKSRDTFLSTSNTTLDEFKCLKSLSDESRSLGVQLVAENAKVYETVSEVLEDVKSNKTVIESYSSRGAAEGTEIMEELRTIKGLALESKMSTQSAEILSEVANVKGLVQIVTEDAANNKAHDDLQLKSIVDSSEKASNSLSTILNSLESLKEESASVHILESVEKVRSLIEEESLKMDIASVPVLESVAKLNSLVEDHQAASLSPRILDMTKAIEETMKSHTQSIEDVHRSIQDVKDETKTSLILSEVDTLKNAILDHTPSLLAIQASVGGIDRKIQGTKDAIIESVHEVHLAVAGDEKIIKECINGLAADMKGLDSKLETSTNVLRADVRAVDGLVQASGETIQQSLTTTSNIHSLASTIRSNMNELLTERLPKLRQDLEAIDLSKLHITATETGKAVSSVSDAVQELSKVTKGHGTQLFELDGKVTGASDLSSKDSVNLQTAVEALNATLVQSNQESSQEMTKNKDLLLSHIDDNIKLSSTRTEALVAKISAVQNELKSVHAAIDKSRIEAVQAIENGNEVRAISINRKISETFSTLETQLSGSISILDKFLTKAITSTIETGEAHTATLETINSSLSTTTSEIATLNSSISRTHIPSVLSAIDKTQSLIKSQKFLLDNVTTDILSNNTSTASALSALSSSVEDLSSSMGNTTAAVRVNSAAISRVDHAVLETGAQVKSVVLEGNSKLSHEIDVALEQLDERLHDSGTRIMGITDFDLPRLEETVKGLEGMVERTMSGNLKAVGRTRDALGVIGARVIGTQKMFEEMVETHAAREEGGGSRSLEGSGILRPGLGDHRRMGSTRFRAGSNASSGKDTAGSAFKGMKPDKHS